MGDLKRLHTCVRYLKNYESSLFFQWFSTNPWRGPLTITCATILHILWPTPKVVVVASIWQTWSYELTFCKYVYSLTILANKFKIIMEGGKVHITSKVAKEFCMQQFDYTNCHLTIMPRPSNPSQGLINSFTPDCFKMHAMMGLVSSSGIVKSYSCRHLYMDYSVKFLIIFGNFLKSFSQCWNWIHSLIVFLLHTMECCPLHHMFWGWMNTME